MANPSDSRQRNIWMGDFEGMRRHFKIQYWDSMLVGDIETKWLRFKAVLLDLIENFFTLARSKRPLAKPWPSRDILVMQKQKKNV